MLIDISVGSRFHAFDLARELDLRGAMRTLHTGYPATSARRFGLRRSMFESVWTHEPLNRMLWRLRSAGFVRGSYDAALSGRYDRIVSRRLAKGADLFIGWSSQARLSLQRARTLGMKTIVERGSSHIVWQHEILEKEQRRTGLPVDVPLPATIKQELAEYLLADYIAVPSGFAARSFVEMGVPEEKLLINPYGVDLKQFNVESRSSPPSGEIRVIHVGRSSIRKGVHYLIRAAELVRGAHVTFVGAIDRGMLPVIQRPWSTVVGPVPGSELCEYYAAADVFCLLSIEEGLALVIAQAMACGLPVIVTANTGAEELVNDGIEGFIVPIGSPNAVAEKLKLLRDEPKRRLEMGRRARARVQNGFGWSDYGQRAYNHYQNILRKL